MSDFQKYLDDVLGNVEFKKNDSKQTLQYDIVVEVQKLLTDTRNQLELSQKELSEKTGISQANISKIETGHSVPSLPVLKRLADGMGRRLVIDFVMDEEE